MAPDMVDGLTNRWMEEGKAVKIEDRGRPVPVEKRRTNARRFKGKMKKKLSKRAQAQEARQIAFRLHRGLYRGDRTRLAKLLAGQSHGRPPVNTGKCHHTGVAEGTRATIPVVHTSVP